MQGRAALRQQYQNSTIPQAPSSNQHTPATSAQTQVPSQQQEQQHHQSHNEIDQRHTSPNE